MSEVNLNRVYKYVITIIAFGLHFLCIKSNDYFTKGCITTVYIFLFNIVNYYEKNHTYTDSMGYAASAILKIIFFILFVDLVVYIINETLYSIENLEALRMKVISSSFAWTLFMALYYRIFVVKRSFLRWYYARCVGKKNIFNSWIPLSYCVGLHVFH